MKLVMTLLARDESDIIRANLDFHIAQGVDLVLATDNLSVDGTRDILREYEACGLLHYIFEPNDNYNQHEWVTRMARMAYSEFGADWVINSDADEFWWPLNGNLKTTLKSLSYEVNLLRAPRHNFVMTGDSSQPFWTRMIYRETQSKNPLGRPLPPKVAHRGQKNIRVEQGNHKVAGFGNPVVVAAGESIEILHFPIRSLRQIEEKIKKGGAAYARNDDLAPSVGATWRELYAQYQAKAGLDQYFQQNFYSKDRIAKGLQSAELLLDRRLHDFLASRYSVSDSAAQLIFHGVHDD